MGYNVAAKVVGDQVVFFAAAEDLEFALSVVWLPD